MARIFPFRAWRYNPLRVGDLSGVLTQPYDKITAHMQQRYYAHPFNLVRIIRGKTSPQDGAHSNVYTRAADTFRRWIDEGILVQDEHPSIYAYYQRYRRSQAHTKVRKGFIALGQIEDYGAGIVYPHERTLSGPKADRLKLLRATRAHFGQLFMLYADPQQRIEELLDEQAAGPPEIQVRDEYDVEHIVWPIRNEAVISQLQALMADRSLIIADGHHRYETALAYRDERRASEGEVDLTRPYERVMMTFFNTESEGLTILPTHRLIKPTRRFDFHQFLAFAQQHFDIEPYPFTDSSQKGAAASSLRRDMEHAGRAHQTFGLYARDGSAFYRLTFQARPASLALMSGMNPRQRQLDVAILHSLIIEQGLGISADVIAREEPIAFIREFDVGVRLVDEGQGSACFFLNPTRVEQVRELALAGEVLPQKSTDFFPKLLSGLTIYRTD